MLNLQHYYLDVYEKARLIVKLSYQLTDNFPGHERYSLILQIRRAATSVKLNIAEGASRKSPAERRRFYEIARSSLVELDTSFETSIDLSFITKDDLLEMSKLVNSAFAMLTKMIAGT